MPTQTAFWDKIADKYDGKVVKGPNYAARIERAAAWVGPDASVLDVGCAGGRKRDSPYIRRRVALTSASLSVMFRVDHLSH